MNSALPKNSNIGCPDLRTQEGTRTGFVLFASILLFSCHIFSCLAVDQPASRLFLQISQENTLKQVVVEQPGSIAGNQVRFTNSSYRFTPYFFKAVPVNFSNRTLLKTVNGVGPSLAEKIITTREELGYFAAPEDLLKVQGIGASRMKKFSPQFSFTQDLERL